MNVNIFLFTTNKTICGSFKVWSFKKMGFFFFKEQAENN